MHKSAGIDWPTVARMLGGGALLGGGAGAAVTFINHLKELQEGSKPPSPEDDNVLYLDLPAKPNTTQAARRMPFKRASAGNVNTAPTFALSSLAGLVGSALAYNTVRDVYNRRRKREIESDLANEQHIYLGGLAGTKSASPYSMPTKIIGTGYLSLLLTALGSAVVANKMLQKRFPPLQSPTAGQPRKIVIRTVDPTTHKPVTSGTSLPGDTNPDAVEGLVRTQMADTKMAAHNEIVDVVHAVAAGRASELKNLIKTAGVDGMLSAVKGASFTPTHPVDRNLAITWICHDPLMREALSPIIAAEFFKSASWTFDLLPRLHTLGLDEDHLVGLVESSARAVRANVLAPVLEKMSSIKSAESMTEGVSPMKTLFFAGALNSIMDHDPNRTHDSTQGISPNVVRSEESAPPNSRNRRHQGIDLEISDDQAHDWAAHNIGAVDRTLARG